MFSGLFTASKAAVKLETESSEIVSRSLTRARLSLIFKFTNCIPEIYKNPLGVVPIRQATLKALAVFGDRDYKQITLTYIIFRTDYQPLPKTA
jgi:hypothetical protein